MLQQNPSPMDRGWFAPIVGAVPTPAAGAAGAATAVPALGRSSAGRDQRQRLLSDELSREEPVGPGNAS